MITLCLTVVSLLVSAPVVEVQRLDGTSVNGELLKLDSKSISLQAPGADSSLSLATKEIIALEVAQEKTEPADDTQSNTTAEVHLADSSRIIVSHWQLEDRQVVLSLANKAKLTAGKSSLAGIRFTPADSTEANDPEVETLLRRQWNELVDQRTGQDAIVLARGDALVVQEVIIRGVSKEGIDIQLDDISTTVNRAKLYGLLFYQRAKREFPSPLCEVHLADGSQLSASSLVWGNGQLEVATRIGVKASFSLDRLKKIDYAAGNIQFLDDLPMTRVTWSPVIKSGIPNSVLAPIYAPRLNRSFHDEPLRLEIGHLPQTFSRGVAVHATSELLYDLPSGYRQLQMKAGIAPRSASNCTARLTIVGDQKVLYEHDFVAETKPQDIMIDLSGVRRLKIMVDALDGEDFDDVLHLCQARLLK